MSEERAKKRQKSAKNRKITILDSTQLCVMDCHQLEINSYVPNHSFIDNSFVNSYINSGPSQFLAKMAKISPKRQFDDFFRF